MTKNEFLNILRQSLEGEIDQNEIEQNIQYYDQYIGIRPASEEARILSELGDPRLIAKSIIEANRAAKQKVNWTDNGNFQNDYYGTQNQDTDTRHNIMRKGIQWYHKLAMIVTIVLFLIAILILGGIILRIFVTIGFPILLVLFLLYLFRKQ